MVDNQDTNYQPSPRPSIKKRAAKAKAAHVHDVRKENSRTPVSSDTEGYSDREDFEDQENKKGESITENRILQNKTVIPKETPAHQCPINGILNIKTLGVIGVLLAILFFVVIPSHSRKTPIHKDLFKEANALLLKAKSDFCNQSNLTWRVFNVTIKGLIRDLSLPQDEKKPATVMVLGTEDGRDLANCISKRIQKIVNSVVVQRNCAEIRVQNLPKNEDDLKLKLQTDVINSFNVPCRAVVIEDVDFLDTAGLMTLQPFSDDTSDHKDVIMFLTATTREPFPEESTQKSFSDLARKHLESVWNAHDDYRSAWLSRFLQYVAVVRTQGDYAMCDL